LEELHTSSLSLFSLKAACIALAFHILSFYEEDSGREAGISLLDCSRPGNVRYRIHSPAGCNTSSIHLVEDALHLALGVRPLGFAVECSEEPGGLRYEGLAGLMVRSYNRLARRLLEELSRSSREYFVIVGWNGLYALGAAREDRVELPQLPAPVFMHTHPGPLCLPSFRDLESAAEFFAGGGVAEFIASSTCSYAILLKSHYTLDCYDKLREAAACVKRSAREDFYSYTECLALLARSECIEAATV